MNTVDALKYISAGVGIEGANASYKIGGRIYPNSRDAGLSVGMRNAVGSEYAALGRRVAQERVRLSNNDHDLYHYAPKLLELIAFERGEMP